MNTQEARKKKTVITAHRLSLIKGKNKGEVLN